MYVRSLCFALAMLLAVVIGADERKKETNFRTNVNFAFSNSSNKPVELWVSASRRKGDKPMKQKLAALGAYDNTTGAAGIFYHINTTTSHALFYVVAEGKTVSNKQINFNGLATNPPDGGEINGEAQHLGVYTYADSDGNWHTTWNIQAGKNPS